MTTADWIRRPVLAILNTVTWVPTATLAVSIEVGGAVVTPGGRAFVPVTLHSEGAVVVGVQVDLGFEDVSIAATEGGRPACVALCEYDYEMPTYWPFPDSGPGAVVGGPAKGDCGSAVSFQPLGCTPGITCKGVRLLGINLYSLEPIPNGATVFICLVEAPRAVQSGTIRLPCAYPGASDDNGNALPTTCADGLVGVGCSGDCNGDGVVRVDELVKGFNIAAGAAPLGTCSVLDASAEGDVEINELVRARISLHEGCR
jgi:hypothetical protein